MSVLTPPRPAATAPPARVGRRTRRPATLLATSAVVVLALAGPLAFLVVQASGIGWGPIAHLLFRSLTASLLWNTVRLSVVVTALCAVIGTLCAYLVERTDLPGRRLWGALLVVPFAIPDFVVGFGWASIDPGVAGYWGAVLVMTLAVYPLVYLPVAAALRGADPGLEEVARSLGLGRLARFWRVTVGQARRAILGGCLLVTLVILAEYGAFEILGYQTFTTEIFSEYSVGFDLAAASALSLVLVGLSLVALVFQNLVHERHGVRVARGAARRHAPQHLGRATAPVLLGVVALVIAALGVPVGATLYWMTRGASSTLAGDSLVGAGLTTAAYAAAAGLLATLMALPIALLVVRHPSRLRSALSQSTLLILAVPGVVIALALSSFSEEHLGGLGYQSAPLLVLAYALMFFPLALVGVRASVAQAPRALEEVAGSLGLTRARVFGRVTLPLVAPGLAAAFCLVFLSVVTELTATLILIPTGAQTLATQFWAYQQNLAYGQAAPFALAMMVVAAVPAYLLGRFFDRLPTQRASALDPRVLP
ncbi:MAG: ABC transporter permease [Acidimicrobiales bacterium]